VERVGRLLGTLFGLLMLVLSVAVAVETVVRKLFSVSLGGVDELSGYAIAVGAPLAFAVTLINRAHIRINILHMRLPERVQSVLNALAAIALGVLALYLFIFAMRTVLDTYTYKSIAQTPWATPLIYPQVLWTVSMSVFAACALVFATRAVLLVSKGRWKVLNREFNPMSVEEELESELDYLKQR
jgi:TRAP-type C4-dicarboxylate transport system permease small subunit